MRVSVRVALLDALSEGATLEERDCVGMRDDDDVTAAVREPVADTVTDEVMDAVTVSVDVPLPLTVTVLVTLVEAPALALAALEASADGVTGGDAPIDGDCNGSGAFEPPKAFFAGEALTPGEAAAGAARVAPRLAGAAAL